MSGAEEALAAADDDLAAGDPAAALSRLSPLVDAHPVAHLGLAEAQLMLSAPRAALAHAQAAEAAFGADDPEAGWWVAEALLSCWDLEPARARWRALAETGWPDAWARLSLAEDLCGDLAAGDAAWREAVLAAPTQFAPFARLDDEAFDRVVEGAMAELQPSYGRFLSNCRVVREPVPFPELCPPGDPGCVPPDLLGLFSGPTLEDQAEAASDMPSIEGLLPPTIHLFQRNLQRRYPDPDELRVEIRTTLFHEVGHLLGLDEDEVDAMGLG